MEPVGPVAAVISHIVLVRIVRGPFFVPFDMRSPMESQHALERHPHGVRCRTQVELSRNGRALDVQRFDTDEPVWYTLLQYPTHEDS